MGKTEISSRKLQIPREHFMQNGPNKDRNGRDRTETDDINQRWQEYTDELYKKDLYDPDNHDGVITHLLLLLLLSHFSRVRLCATPWTAAHQAPLSLGFSRQ